MHKNASKINNLSNLKEVKSMIKQLMNYEQLHRYELFESAIGDCYTRMSTNRNEHYRKEQMRKADFYFESMTAIVDKVLNGRKELL
jgi:hypothetical protein